MTGGHYGGSDDDDNDEDEDEDSVNAKGIIRILLSHGRTALAFLFPACVNTDCAGKADPFFSAF